MLKINVSDKAIKVYISQLNNKKYLHLVTFYSQKFISAEINYKIHNKELLAIINTFKQ